MKYTTLTSSIVLALCGGSAYSVHADSTEKTLNPQLASVNVATVAEISGGSNNLNTHRSSDSDSDGIADSLDNCTLTANADQRDTDGDGYGNVCDGDLNNDLAVNVVDLGLFRSRFFTGDADADLNGDGIVNVVDLGIFRTLYFNPVGPSAVGNIGPLAPEVEAVGDPEFFGQVGENYFSLDGNFMVTWTNSPAATNYNVVRQKTNPPVATVTTNVSGLPVLDQPNVPNGVYVYTVEACTSAGVCGDFSDPIQVEVERGGQ